MYGIFNCQYLQGGKKYSWTMKVAFWQNSWLNFVHLANQVFFYFFKYKQKAGIIKQGKKLAQRHFTAITTMIFLSGLKPDCASLLLWPIQALAAGHGYIFFFKFSSLWISGWLCVSILSVQMFANCIKSIMLIFLILHMNWNQLIVIIISVFATVTFSFIHVIRAEVTVRLKGSRKYQLRKFMFSQPLKK